MDDDDLRMFREEMRSQLRGHLREVGSHVAGVANAVSRMHDDVGKVVGKLATRQDALSGEVDSIRQSLAAFVARNEREMATLIALTKLVDVRAELDRKYGHYVIVRRRAAGLLDAMDNDLAEPLTATLLAEEMSIDSSDYWLASMANASAAWLRDDAQSTSRALRHAISQNRGRSALYAGLLNARYRRLRDTGKWLEQYFGEQDPAELPSDFVIVLDAAVVGALGVRTRDYVGRWCMATFEDLAKEPVNEDTQVKRWAAVLRSYSDTAPAESPLASAYPVLSRVAAPAAREISAGLRAAQCFGRMSETLRSRATKPPAVPTDRRHKIDELLTRLRNLPEPGEEDLRVRERDYERIVGLDGDEAWAEAGRLADAPLERPTVDLMTLFTNIAQRPARYKVSPETAQLAKVLSIKPLVRAIREAQQRSRDAAAAPIDVTIENWSYALLPGGRDETAVAGLTAALDRMTRRHEARERRLDLIAGAVMIIFTGLLAYGLSLYWGKPTLSAFALVPLVITLVAAGALLMIRARTPERIRQAQEAGEERKQRALSDLDRAMAERDLLHKQWTARLTAGDELVERVESAELPMLDSDPVALEQEAKAIEKARAELLSRPGARGPRLPEWSLTLPAE